MVNRLQLTPKWKKDPKDFCLKAKFSTIQVWLSTSESAFVGKSPNFVPFLLISEEVLDMLLALKGKDLDTPVTAAR